MRISGWKRQFTKIHWLGKEVKNVIVSIRKVDNFCKQSFTSKDIMVNNFSSQFLMKWNYHSSKRKASLQNINYDTP